MFKVYVSSSMQENNVGVGAYGTEENRMFELADKVAELLRGNGNFEVFRNKKEWTLEQLVEDVNAKCDKNSLFIDNHSNAGHSSAQGTEVYYYGQGGTGSNSYRIAKLLYDKIAPIGIGIDRGIKPDTVLYASGLYVVQKTEPPACLIEHFFHTNVLEVPQFLNNMDRFARAEYDAICEYFGVPVEPAYSELDMLRNERDLWKAKFDKIKAFVNEV